MNNILKSTFIFSAFLLGMTSLSASSYAKDANVETETNQNTQEKMIGNMAFSQDPFYVVNQNVDNMLRNFYFDFPNVPMQRFYIGTSNIGNNANIVDKKDKIEVTIELPGMTKEDIEIILKDSILTVKGEKKKEKDIKEDSYYLQERQYGSFSRSIRLPDNIKEDKISSKLENGVLKIDIPKDEINKTKEKKIPIN